MWIVPGPPLAEVERTVRIVAADVLAAVLLQPLHAAVAAHAPGLDLVFHAWDAGQAALGQLTKGAVDLAVSVLPPADPRQFMSKTVREEYFLLAMRADHPIAMRRNAAGWLDHPHILVSAEGATRSVMDDTLAAAGPQRRIGVTVPSFLLVPELLRGTDMLALVPSLCVAGDRGTGLETRRPPVPMAGFRLDLARHRRSESDVAVGFVASEIEHILDVV